MFYEKDIFETGVNNRLLFYCCCQKHGSVSPIHALVDRLLHPRLRNCFCILGWEAARFRSISYIGLSTTLASPMICFSSTVRCSRRTSFLRSFQSRKWFFCHPMYVVPLQIYIVNCKNLPPWEGKVQQQNTNSSETSEAMKITCKIENIQLCPIRIPL